MRTRRVSPAFYDRAMRGWRVLAGCILVAGCSDDAGAGETDVGAASSSTTVTSTSGPSTEGPTSSSTTAGVTTDEATTDAPVTSGSGDPTTGAQTSSSSGGVASDCDYETVDGMVVIEAENLPVGEDWQVLTDEAGYAGAGYIAWTGDAFNGDPTHGVTSATVHIGEPGRYRLVWRNRIGMGTDTTEHNDTWVKFPDAADTYGVQVDGETESRVYPRPRCEDEAAMAAIEAMPQVSSAGCVEGSSTDDWFKVYSSGATDWSWSSFTNDFDGHRVMAEFDAAGDYTFMIAARANWSLLDRIVIHEESLEDGVVMGVLVGETVCE